MTTEIETAKPWEELSRLAESGSPSELGMFLGELPASDVLSPNQISEWIRSATMPEEAISDKDVGLAEEPEFEELSEAPQQAEEEAEAPVEEEETLG